MAILNKISINTGTYQMEATTTGIRALLVGATGLIGGHCLAELLYDHDFSAVTVLTRRPLEWMPPKLTVQVADFERLAAYPEAFQVDVVLCCIGTTYQVAGSLEAFAKVDHIYVAELARLAAAHGAKRFILVSAVSADLNSPIFYNKIKGRAEAAVMEQRFQAVHILRPSLLLGPRWGTRHTEYLLQIFAPAWSWLLWGPFKRYRAIRAEAVATRMVELAKSAESGVHYHYFGG